MRTVLVTGAARGIGRAIAGDLATDHAVAVTHNTTPPDALLAEHPAIHAIHADLSDQTTAPGIIDAVIAKFGRLDVIVNNAGAIEMDDGNAHLNHAVNVAAPMALLTAALPHQSAGATIVNISFHQRHPARQGRGVLFCQQGRAEPVDPRNGQRAGPARHPRQRRRSRRN
ncbi:SDR family NAD(P)-dependent oxidoreductase [Pseudosulfitobacter sp. DSM 107133]|uniref:SDR family NAD(P)-dependent oxidoreductase n=1 Tax=Pseudosulfitobacter sp. DSM 107133 TaxID=2883100 RepID=UPI0013B3982B